MTTISSLGCRIEKNRDGCLVTTLKGIVVLLVVLIEVVELVTTIGSVVVVTGVDVGKRIGSGSVGMLLINSSSIIG